MITESLVRLAIIERAALINRIVQLRREIAHEGIHLATLKIEWSKL
jgi:hypothetical protein